MQIPDRQNLVIDLLADVNRSGLLHPQMLAQAGVLLLVLLLAWCGNTYLKPKLGLENSRWRAGGEGLLRIFFPLNALILLFIGGRVLGLIYPERHSLLAISAVLLTAMANIRVLVYMLQHVFDGAHWVRRGERYIAAAIWGVYVLHVLGILPEVAEALDAISFTMGKSRISVLLILQGIASVAATLLIALWVARLFERRLMRASVIDMNVRVVLVKLVQTGLVVLAVIIALPLVGIDLTVLSVFGGALGVGLGFGLQKIASNYVSGFIILIDRSIKIGDLVTIDNRQGVIASITSRYVVLKSADGTEALIPNDTLVTSTVVNQSYLERKIWTKVPVSVAYESDLDHVMKLLVDIASAHPRIMTDPPPRAYIETFGASSVDMSVGFWLKDPENGQLSLRSEINQRIWAAFREHGVNIPFNRLDVVHFRPNERQAGDGNLQGCSQPE
ncbi:mechanosensitive ion channel family protein [Jeongeupia chitinilytica]|uniref:Mechanosensitive ion channel protein MscS n=1 Tax=Jeongeupia chitinilytica TaxID=1041641 RepID=A0ABQ3H2D9_9NEIS|nr:mechanosensitive ion channel domain-containing protein [Jeongeupia chitinilytica]GHD65274.1 mechanosensitive ion channel protein MscS [Jeongeupia chitinilytica]